MSNALAFPRKILPGLALCAAVSAVAYAGDALEAHVFGKAWLETLVLAILIGAVVRTAWTPPPAVHRRRHVLGQDAAGDRHRAARPFGQLQRR